MFGKFKKMISLFVAAAVIAGALIPVYGENAGGNTDILQGGNSVAEEEGWVTFNPSKTSEWESTIEGDNYISNEIHQLMQNVAFKATFRPTASFFAELMRAAWCLRRPIRLRTTWTCRLRRSRRSGRSNPDAPADRRCRRC